MPENVNRQFVLKSRPDGMPREADFDLVETTIPSPEFGQILIKSLWMSIDPYMRGRITSSPVGDVIEVEIVRNGERLSIQVRVADRSQF